MDNNLLKYKEELLNTGLFRRVSEGQYVCKTCPFCGDTKSHMYVLIKLNDDTPVLYNCFKCNSHGVMNKKFLSYFNLNDIKIPRGKGNFKKKIDVAKASSSIEANKYLVNENDNADFVCHYIESRVGHYPTLSELQFFQYLSKPMDYAKEYLGGNYKPNTFKNRYWFRLTNGNIIGRYKDDSSSYRWCKYNSNNISGRGMYTIKLPFDLYKPVNVYIAEGVMDVIGLYYNYIQDNNVYIAVLGREYVFGIQHMINMGIYGDSVNIKIFKDSDVNTDDIKVSMPVRSLFNKIEIYQNASGKDYGLLPNELDIQKVATLRKGASI